MQWFQISEQSETINIFCQTQQWLTQEIQNQFYNELSYRQNRNFKMYELSFPPKCTQCEFKIKCYIELWAIVNYTKLFTIRDSSMLQETGTEDHMLYFSDTGSGQFLVPPAQTYKCNSCNDSELIYLSNSTSTLFWPGQVNYLCVTSMKETAGSDYNPLPGTI